MDLIAEEVLCEQRLVELGQLAPQLAGATWRSHLPETVERELAAVEQADILVVATPVYRGSYTGLFKHFFDFIDQDALIDKPVLLAATGGSERHALMIDHQLRPLFSFFQARTLPLGVYATDKDFTDYRLRTRPDPARHLGRATGIALIGLTRHARSATAEGWSRLDTHHHGQSTYSPFRRHQDDHHGKDFVFSIKSIVSMKLSPIGQHAPDDQLANLARGERRQENLRNTLKMIDSRFNNLAHWDNPKADRYSIELEIISVALNIDAEGDNIPLIEILKPNIIDKKTNERIDGIAGNNFSSYVRDYDFSVLLPEHNNNKSTLARRTTSANFHGKLFKHFVRSDTYKAHFSKPPVICIVPRAARPISALKPAPHPWRRVPTNEFSPTDEYFEKMGMQVRYFMPPNSSAPLAFYFIGDLLADYSNLELIGTISTMETFQKIYRPEIYNANSAAGKLYQPSLKNQDYSLTQIVYDREERSQLAVKQGKYTEEHFIKPYKNILEQWSANYAL